MKKTLRTLALILAVIMTVVCFTACSSNGSNTDKQYKIGIIQYAPHPSLDNCYKGIVQGLKDAGFEDKVNCTIDYQNGQGESETNNLIASNMVSSKYDIIIAIATPSAMAAYSAAKEANIPVVFSAVSDPVSAGLVKSLEAPDSGATGTSDALNLEGQMKMIRALLPQAKKIGVLYTTSEVNSVTHLKNFEKLAPTYGFTIESVGITDASEVASGAAALVSRGVDCVNNFTDNNVVNNLSVLLNATNSASIPVFGSEEEQVKNGCIASETLDYVALGQTTGKMAADVLGGKDINTMAVSVVTDSKPVYSSTVLEKFGLALPESYASATDVNA